MDKIEYRRNDLLRKYFNCNSAKEMLSEVFSDLEKNNKVVCAVYVNGQELSDEGQKNIDMEIEEVDFLEIEYCDHFDFYAEFLDSTKSFLQDLIAICPHMSQALSEANYQVFHKMFTDFADSMESFISALYFVQNESGQKIAEDKWKAQEKRLSAVLQQMLDAYSDSDYVVLADLIEYEMMDDLKVWYKIIDRLSKKGM